MAVGNGAADTVATAVGRAGGAGAALSLVSGEARTQAGGAVTNTLVGALTVEMGFVVFCYSSGAGVTVVGRVQFRLATTDEVDTKNLGVETRVEVSGRAVLAVTIQVADWRVDKGGGVGANAIAAVGTEPVTIAVTLRCLATSAVAGTVVGASRGGRGGEGRRRGRRW